MIKLGIIGTGGMANVHADVFNKINGCKVTAACDIDEKRVKDFAEKHKIPQVFTDVDDMLANSGVDAITNVTPDAMHAPISLKCISAGKHILCEKPLALNYADASKMAAAAKRKGVINMVNFSYRGSWAIHKAHQLVSSGAIGRVMHVEASYLQSWLVGNRSGDWRKLDKWLWRLSTEHGSKGVLGDVGVHIVDFATYAVGEVKNVNCRLKTFHKAPKDKIGKYKLDANDSAIITVEFVGGAIGTIHTTRWATGNGNSVKTSIFGDKGAIIIDLDKSGETLQICRGNDVNKCAWKTLKCPKTPGMYQRFITSVRTGKNSQPDFARGAAVQKILDSCFKSAETGKTVNVK